MATKRFVTYHNVYPHATGTNTGLYSGDTRAEADTIATPERIAVLRIVRTGNNIEVDVRPVAGKTPSKVPAVKKRPAPKRTPVKPKPRRPAKKK